MRSLTSNTTSFRTKTVFLRFFKVPPGTFFYFRVYSVCTSNNILILSIILVLSEVRIMIKVFE